MPDDNAVQLLQAQIDHLNEREATLRRVCEERAARMAEMWRKEVVRAAFEELMLSWGHGARSDAALRALEIEIERIEAGA